MTDNFDIKKFLLENKLGTSSEIEEVTSERVQEAYNKLIDVLNKLARTLSAEENHELREKLRKFITGEVF